MFEDWKEKTKDNPQLFKGLLWDIDTSKITETVERGTFELLKTIMQDESLKIFNLVGGTALALYLGRNGKSDK